MSDDERRLFLNTYAPLVASKAGRDAASRHSLPPFIDGSIRREPDFEHVWPSISCLCRGGNFAPRLAEGDTVVYMTKKARYGMSDAHRRMTAILRVRHVFDSHAEAAEWYKAKGLPLPSNCMVAGNPPNPLDRSHRKNKYSYLPDGECLRRWDGGYRARARRFRRFVVCEPLWRALGSDAVIVHDDDLISVFGRVPATLNPAALRMSFLPLLLRRLRIDVPPSGR